MPPECVRHHLIFSLSLGTTDGTVTTITIATTTTTGIAATKLLTRTTTSTTAVVMFIASTDITTTDAFSTSTALIAFATSQVAVGAYIGVCTRLLVRYSGVCFLVGAGLTGVQSGSPGWKRGWVLTDVGISPNCRSVRVLSRTHTIASSSRLSQCLIIDGRAHQVEG